MACYNFGPNCSVTDARTGEMVPVPQGIHDVTWEETISKANNPPECTIHDNLSQTTIRTFRSEIIRLCEEGKAKPHP